MVHTTREARATFEKYCENHNIDILRVLQEGLDKNYVALVHDTDGIVKIMKYVWQPKTNDIQNIYDGESAIYTHLKNCPPSKHLPNYYGIEVMEEESLDTELFVRQSFLWGQSLKEYIRSSKLLSSNEICCIILDIAQQLQWLHEHKIWHRDVRPENIHIWEHHAYLFDLDLAKIVPDSTEAISTRVTDPYYAVPECVIMDIATEASDTFQLGILFHELLYGTHPFVTDFEMGNVTEFEEEVTLYEWANATAPYVKEDNGKLALLIESMLRKDSRERASLEDVIAELTSLDIPRHISHRARKIPIHEHNIIMFPMRMGIPHKGHIEYLSRILELGYYVIVSLQRSYTITDDDPIHKSIVMKIVAQALFARGFTKNHFHFVFTPYETEEKMRMHFAMMPHRQDVVGIASGNPEVHELFKGQKIFDQKSVFGIENEEWENRSWGKRLREAVKNNDRETYLELIPDGSDTIITLGVLRMIYGTPGIAYVAGRVMIELKDDGGNTLLTCPAMRYISPEETIARALNGQPGQSAGISDLYKKETLINLNSIIYLLRFIGIEMWGDNETLVYSLLPCDS